jgi:histone H3/H4
MSDTIIDEVTILRIEKQICDQRAALEAFGNLLTAQTELLVSIAKQLSETRR